MSTLPILLLQSRPEDEVSDNEYESICRLGGIDPQRVRRLRMERDALGEVNLADYAAVMMGGGPANFAASEDKKSPEQRRYEAWLIRLMQQIIQQDKPFFGMCLGMGALAMARGMQPSFAYGEPVMAAEIHLSAEGERDPLLAGVPGPFIAITGHKEGLAEVPAGGVELARTAACVHMYRIGQHVYATQFHPELDAASLALRVKAYQHHGYFPPEEGDAIVASVAGVDVSAAHVVLRNFVRRYVPSKQMHGERE